jgi:hypothetical protein
MNGPMRLRQGGRNPLFDEDFAQGAKSSSKRNIMYHAAAGDSAFHLVKHPV